MSRAGNWVIRHVAITKSTWHVLLNLGLQMDSGRQQTHFKKQMLGLKKASPPLFTGSQKYLC